MAGYAIDGDVTTSWSSEFYDPQWIYIDLETTYYISGVEILWEGASAKEYTIDVSYDGIFWTTVSTQTNIATGPRNDVVNEINRYARYVRIYGISRNTSYGYSIYELRVIGQPISCSQEMVNGAFNWSLESNDVTGKLEVIFTPARTGIAENMLDGTTTPIILYYGEDPNESASWYGHHLNPNEPYEIIIPAGMKPDQPLFFYFTYSEENVSGGQNNSKDIMGVTTKNSCKCNDFYSVFSERNVFTKGFNEGVDGQV